MQHTFTWIDWSEEEVERYQSDPLDVWSVREKRVYLTYTVVLYAGLAQQRLELLLGMVFRQNMGFLLATRKTFPPASAFEHRAEVQDQEHGYGRLVSRRKA